MIPLPFEEGGLGTPYYLPPRQGAPAEGWPPSALPLLLITLPCVHDCKGAPLPRYRGTTQRGALGRGALLQVPRLRDDEGPYCLCQLRIIAYLFSKVERVR